LGIEGLQLFEEALSGWCSEAHWLLSQSQEPGQMQQRESNWRFERQVAHLQENPVI